MSMVGSRWVLRPKWETEPGHNEVLQAITFNKISGGGVVHVYREVNWDHSYH